MTESLVTVQFTDNRPLTPELQAWLDFCGEKASELLQEQYREFVLYGRMSPSLLHALEE